MEKINPVSLSGLILMGIKSGSLTSLVSIILLCMVLCCLIELHRFYSSTTSHPTLDYFLYAITWKRYANGTNSEAENLTPKSYITNENICNRDESMMLGGEVEMVMERLGLYCNPNGDKLQERIGSSEIATLFHDNEPSLEEVKHAFDVFDENGDGYIDEKELEKVLCKLGFKEFSKMECRRMITSYDDNGDGLIDFTEFSKLFEDCFP